MPQLTLRPYQDRAIAGVREAFRAGHQAVLLQAPTGAGKTVMATFILGNSADRGFEGWFICNRVELLEQTARTFDKNGIRYGLIAPSYRPDFTVKTQIVSIDTLKARLARGIEFRPPGLIVWDECRSIASTGWAKVHGAFKTSKHVGLDATPMRNDGRGLGDYFSHLVHGPSYSELVEVGALVPFDSYAPTRPDMSGAKIKGGDFDQTASEALMDKPSITGDIVDHYLRHGRGKRGLTFAVSRKHSEHLAEAYRAAGVRAVHLDGDTDAGERKRMVAAYRRGEIEVLTNVDLFTAGFDVPGVQLIQMARPTQSLTMFLQQAGRGSRPDEENPAKTSCILLDHAGNVFRHGLPDEDRTWSLDAKKRASRKKNGDVDSVNVRQCERCFGVHAPRPICPHCGFEYPIQSREVDEREGQLKKLTKEEAAAAKAAAQVEVKRARTLDDLRRIEAARGYKPGWADRVFETKKVARERAIQRSIEHQAKSYMR